MWITLCSSSKLYENCKKKMIKFVETKKGAFCTFIVFIETKTKLPKLGREELQTLSLKKKQKGF